MGQTMPLVLYRPNGVREILGTAEVEYEIVKDDEPPQLVANFSLDKETQKRFEGLVGTYKLSHRNIEVNGLTVKSDPEIVFAIVGRG
jgi:hypothetical protein